MFVALGSGVYAALGGNIRQSSSGDIELQRGLVSWYKMDGNVKDAMPNANNASANTGSFSTDRKGRTSSALTTDGITQYASVPDSNSLDTGSITVSLWAKVNSAVDCDANNNWRSLIRKGGTASTTNGWDIVLEQDGGDINWDVGIGGATSRLGAGSGSGLTLGATKLLTATYDATTGDQKVYLNGIQVASKTNTPTAIGINTAPIDVGRGINAVACPNGNGYAPVIYDDIRIYNRAINTNEAKALYEQYDSTVQLGSGQDGLVGHWKLDGNAKDATPYSNNGIVTGAVPASDRKGKSGSAYAFSANTDTIVIPSSPVLNTPVFTYTAWVRPTSIATNSTIIGSASAGGPQFILQASTGRLYLNKQNVVSIDGTSSVVPLNTWTHVAVSYDASGYYVIYINGVEQPTLGASPNPQTFTFSNFKLGMKHTTTESFVGSIDDVRIYNRVLSGSEVQEMSQSYDSQINVNSAPTTTAVSGNISQGLVGYWPFSGNAKDATPYSGNGTLVNAPALTADRKGRLSSAYNFVYGSSQEIAIPDSPALSPTGALTLSAWFKGSVANTSYATSGALAGLVVKDIGGSTAQNPIYGFTVTSGTLNFVANNSSNVQASISSSGLIDNTWYHAVGTFDGTNIRLYVNGQFKSSATQTNLDNSTGPLRIGRQKSGFDRFFNGDIDDVRVYDRALSLAEVQALYTSAN
ncbi:MAG: 5-Nucleotidase domain protein [Candidatus Saccharibacteria bacterium]|nr:5-Nucleotidase domain protein [Candidatus Saccharibacteria bacterium]